MVFLNNIKNIFFNFISYENFKWNLNNNYLIKFLSIIFNKTPLYIAVEKGNRDIVQLLIANENIDVNIANILIFIMK